MRCPAHFECSIDVHVGMGLREWFAEMNISSWIIFQDECSENVNMKLASVFSLYIAFLGVSRPPMTVGNMPSLSRKYRPLDLSFVPNENRIKFETNILSFKLEHENKKKITLDVFPILHIGSQSYFDALETRASTYDIVLFELITSTKNTVFQNNKRHRRSLVIDVYSPKAESIAHQFNFMTQLCMKLRKPNWYIADLDAETINNLESERKDIVYRKYLRNKLEGRGGSSKNTLFPENVDTFFIVLLRSVLWFTPCPELGLLLIDWSRVEPSAGGLPQVLYPILENLLTFNILEAKKIAFAQSILSGVSDSGDLGGEAMSDVDIRVKARNEAVYSSLCGFIDEYTSDSESNSNDLMKEKSLQVGKIDSSYGGGSRDDKTLNIAVLYGAYHILDLRQRIRMLGFAEVDDNTRDSCDEKIHTMTVWDMTYPNVFYKDSHNSSVPDASSIKSKVISSSNVTPQIVLSIVSILLYLVVGALDWWSVTNFLVRFSFFQLLLLLSMI